MTEKDYSLDWLCDPEIFQCNTMDPVSFFHDSIPGKNNMQSLNGEWQYRFLKNPKQFEGTFFEENVEFQAEGTLQVPGHIQLQGLGQIRYTNTAYPWDGKEKLEYGQIPQEDNPTVEYVKEFLLEDDLKGMPLTLTFHGAESAIYVWLNGHFVGYAQDSFTPSTFDVTDFIDSEGTNRLCVLNVQYCDGSWLEDQDMFRFSGLFRDVELKALPFKGIRDLKITNDFFNNYTEALLKVWIHPSVSGLQYKVRLKDMDQNTVIEFDTENTYLGIELENIHLWSAENPYLYTLEIDVYDVDQNHTQTITQKVGLREIKIDNGILKLNGKKLMLKGINRHEFSSETGRVLTREQMIEDIVFMKQCNINAVRTAHYPNSNLWYDLCDEYGIYVMDEVNLETHGTWQMGSVIDEKDPLPGSKPIWKKSVLDRGKSMLERDKNHPSIILWSIGNESGTGDTLMDLADYFRSTDPTRPVHYEGCSRDENWEACSDVISRMYLSSKDVKKLLVQKPDKPVLLCEYMHGMGNSMGGLSKYIELESFDQYHGGFLWDFADQAIIYDKDGQKVPGVGGDFGEFPHSGEFSGNGILFHDHTPSPKAAEVKYQFQNIKILPDRFGVKIKNDHLFESLDKYEFDFTLSSEGRIVQQGTLSVSAQPGETQKIFIPWKRDVSEAVRTVRAKLKEKTSWAPAGFEVAFGQTDDGVFPHLSAKQTPMKMIHGQENILFESENFQAVFTQKGLCSIRYDGKEMLAGIPKPVFSHAFTDNEIGSGFDQQSLQWHGASILAKPFSMKCELVHNCNYGIVTYTYKLSTRPEVTVLISYTVASPGVIGVDMTFYGRMGMSPLPLVGIQIPMKKQYDEVIYYGRGPWENYRDRKEGCKLDLYGYSVKDNMTPYLRPQECGNRTDVRWIEALDSGMQGTRFSMVNKPFEVSVLPYSFEQIHLAERQYELGNSTKTYVTVMGEHCGVGGEDSWGSSVDAEYKIDSNQNHSFCFLISKSQSLDLFKKAKEKKRKWQNTQFDQEGQSYSDIMELDEENKSKNTTVVASTAQESVVRDEVNDLLTHGSSKEELLSFESENNSTVQSPEDSAFIQEEVVDQILKSNEENLGSLSDQKVQDEKMKDESELEEIEVSCKDMPSIEKVQLDSISPSEDLSPVKELSEPYQEEEKQTDNMVGEQKKAEIADEFRKETDPSLEKVCDKIMEEEKSVTSAQTSHIPSRPSPASKKRFKMKKRFGRRK